MLSMLAPKHNKRLDMLPPKCTSHEGTVQRNSSANVVLKWDDQRKSSKDVYLWQLLIQLQNESIQEW